MDNTHDVGAAIRSAREAAGLSQAKLAKSVGSTQQTVDRIERGSVSYSRILPALQEALNLAPTGGKASNGAPVQMTGLGKGKARLEINMVVPMGVAIKILSLLDEGGDEQRPPFDCASHNF